MKKISDEIIQGKFFEIESDGDDFTYLLKIINLTEEKIVCENLSMKFGLIRHSDQLGYKLKDIEANEYQIVRMRKSKDKKISLNIVEDEGSKELLNNDISDHNKEITQAQDDEELKGVVTFKLFRNRFDIAFSTQTDGSSNILIGAYSKNNTCMENVNNKDYANRLLAEKNTPISQIFQIKHDERTDKIFFDKNITSDNKQIPFEARIETEGSKFPLLIRYGIIYQPEKNKTGSLNKYTISDSDAIAVVIIDIDRDQH